MATPLHLAAQSGDVNKVRLLIKQREHYVNCRDSENQTPLHYACAGGHLGVVNMLISADVSIKNIYNNTPLHMAALNGEKKVTISLIEDFDCAVNVRGYVGRSLLHSACAGGNVSLVGTVIHEHKADIYDKDSNNDTPLHVAALGGKEEVALALIQDFNCDVDVCGFLGRSLLHSACAGGNVSLVETLIREYKADIDDKDNGNNDTPLHMAALNGRREVALALINDFDCDSNVRGSLGRSLLHSACAGGNVSLVETLIREHKAYINSKDSQKSTPLHVAALNGRREVALALIKCFNCDVNVRGYLGRSLLHSACAGGNVSLVEALIQEYKADINDKDSQNLTPLHIAMLCEKEEVALALIKVSDCSPLNIDEDGDTPLHICASSGYGKCVEALLSVHYPLSIRNKNWKTPLDIAKGTAKSILNEYIYVNKDIIKLQKKNYTSMQKKFISNFYGSLPIIRLFVLGNPLSGKSSLVKSLKISSFSASVSDVSLHTSGVVPSSIYMHVSKHLRRVLFYDFAGDPEYYSSHAAILENIALSRCGDNIFIIVVNCIKDELAIKEILVYWFSFIECQKFSGSKPSLIVVGSHSDSLTEKEMIYKNRVLTQCCKRYSLAKAYFMLDCRKPGSNPIMKEVVNITRHSPRYDLSLDESILLGLLEEELSHVVACSVKTIISHIEDTRVLLPKSVKILSSILFRLHELGLVYLVGDKGSDNMQVILRIASLTESVHKSLFSKEARYTSSGVISNKFLHQILPPGITKECLISLQYCHEINHSDIKYFPSISSSDSSNQPEPLLYFPALCRADKTKVIWNTRHDSDYSIGWLAQLTYYGDFFPPRFLHVLLLRIVFRFALPPPTSEVPMEAQAPEDRYFQRRCMIWKSGVHWQMENGVECMVELVDTNKGVVVITKSREDNCIHSLNDIVSCVMEAKADFCHSVRPRFYLLDSTDEADYLNKSNLIAMSDIERVLTSPGESEVIVSTGSDRNRTMKRKKVLGMLKQTHWYALFPLDFTVVLRYLEELNPRKVYSLGLLLKIRRHVLDAIEVDYSTTERRIREIVKTWMDSTRTLKRPCLCHPPCQWHPPCWWDLVKALNDVDMNHLASVIEEEYSESVVA